MKKNILFTGIYDMFGLKLASALMDRYTAQIYYFGTDDNLNYLQDLIDAIKSSDAKEYLTAHLNEMTLIKDDELFRLTDMNNSNLELWHFDNFYPETGTYNLETLNYNEKEQKRIERICKDYKVEHIHYLSSIYAFIDGELPNVFLKMKELNEEYILKLCKKHHIKGSIYRTPILHKQTDLECENDYVCLLTKRIYDFVKWVKGRIPNYFDNYKVHLLSKNNSEIHIFEVDTVIKKILDLQEVARWDLFKTYHISSKTKYSAMDVCKSIFKDLYDIHAVITDDEEDLTPIDKIFLKLYRFHFLYLQEKTDNVKRLIFNPSKEMDYRKSAPCSEEKLPFVRNSKTKVINIQGDINLTYHVAGSGPAILIVNAYGVSATAWDKLIEHLSKNYYVIYWRSRGLYHNEKIGDEKSYCGISDQVEDIERIVAEEKLNNFHIMSWCSGAKAAIFYNLKHPAKVLSQIFIAGEFAPFEGSDPYHSKFRENIQLIADLIQNNERMLDFYMKIIHKGMFNHPVKEFSSADETYIYEIMPEEHRNILLSPFASKETMVNFLMMCMEYYKHDVTKKIKNIKIPTLFISAECDQVAPYMQSKWAHSLVEDSKFICFPSGTHLLILERTWDVYETIMQHMKFNNFEEGRVVSDP